MTKEKELKFEEALDQLDHIVRKLESGDLPLDEAIKIFEEGTRLRKFCEEKLKETERRVEMIIKEKLPAKKGEKPAVMDFKNGSSGSDNGENVQN
jgi:exodeoxyribonuclease VII small subunit